MSCMNSDESITFDLDVWQSRVLPFKNWHAKLKLICLNDFFVRSVLGVARNENVVWHYLHLDAVGLIWIECWKLIKILFYFNRSQAYHYCLTFSKFKQTMKTISPELVLAVDGLVGDLVLVLQGQEGVDGVDQLCRHPVVLWIRWSLLALMAWNKWKTKFVNIHLF